MNNILQEPAIMMGLAPSNFALVEFHVWCVQGTYQTRKPCTLVMWVPVPHLWAVTCVLNVAGIPVANVDYMASCFGNTYSLSTGRLRVKIPLVYCDIPPLYTAYTTARITAL